MVTSWAITFNPSHVVGFLALWGVGYLLYKRRNLWLIASWALIGYLWIIAATVPRGDFRLLMVGPWYTDHFRLAALIVFPSAVLAGIGLGGFVEGLLTWIVRRVPRTARLNVATAGMGVAAVLVFGSCRSDFACSFGAGDNVGCVEGISGNAVFCGCDPG